MPFPTPEAAEAAFYAAFESRSLDAMMTVWAEDDRVACIHPLAAPLNGRAAVAAGWRSMFAAAGRFRIQVKPVHEVRETGVVIHLVEEFLTIGDEAEPRPPILATNVYRKDADGWRIVLHHASPLQVGAASAGAAPPVVLH